jgi:hypothetical protein
MRLLCVLLIIAAVIYTGWETPLSQQLPWHKSPPTGAQAAAANRGRTRRGITPDPTQVSATVDRPAYNQDRSFTGHILYVDDSGAKYWVDAQGKRHYQP